MSASFHWIVMVIVDERAQINVYFHCVQNVRSLTLRVLMSQEFSQLSVVNSQLQIDHPALIVSIIQQRTIRSNSIF